METIKFKPDGFIAKTLLLGATGSTAPVDPAWSLYIWGYRDSCSVLKGLFLQSMKILFIVSLIFVAAFCIGLGAKAGIIYYMIKGTLVGAVVPFVGTIWEWPAMIGMILLSAVGVVLGVIATAVTFFGVITAIFYCIGAVGSCIIEAKPEGLSRLIESRREKFCVPVEFKE